jgi:small subunit ribosomal protein S6
MAKAQYEGMFLLPAGQSDLDSSLKLVSGLIERHGGQILLIKKFDERKLAYEVKKQKRGLYVLAFFTAPGTAVAGITRDVNLGDDVLRVLITDASHLDMDEMNAIEPQQPPPPAPERSFGGGFGGGGFGGDRPRRRDDAEAPTA